MKMQSSFSPCLNNRVIHVTRPTTIARKRRGLDLAAARPVLAALGLQTWSVGVDDSLDISGEITMEIEDGFRWR